MRRTTVTIPDDLDVLLGETARESLLRRVLEGWLAERGEPASVLRSEGGRIRVLLQLATETLKERALDVGYHEMAVWWEGTDHGRRDARDRAVRREAPRWDAEEVAGRAAAADTSNRG